LKLEKIFKADIINYDIKILSEKDFTIDSKYNFSDIFEFIDDDKIRYLRKN
jgi:hypothetical protein